MRQTTATPRLARALTCLLFCIAASMVGAAEGPDRFHRAQEREFIGLSQEKEGAWKEPFFFVQMADTQFGFFNANKSFEQETALVERAIQICNRLKPRFVVVCGDLTNATPAAPQYEAQVAEFKRLFAKLDPAIPLVCVCGNHDLGNRPTPSSLATYRRNYGDDYFGFWVGGVRCLAINSSLFSKPEGAPDAQEAQEAWFRRELKSAREQKATHILVFQHHSWFLTQPDEPDQYFNIPLIRRQPALAAMRAAGVRAAFAGHYHRNAYGRDGELEMITTSAVGRPLGKDPSGFRIVKVYRDRLDQRYYGLDEVPERVDLAAK